MRGNADRNASIVIGKRLLAQYQTISQETTSQEKPHAPLGSGPGPDALWHARNCRTRCAPSEWNRDVRHRAV
jgi:hypothetical protein